MRYSNRPEQAMRLSDRNNLRAEVTDFLQSSEQLQDVFPARLEKASRRARGSGFKRVATEYVLLATTDRAHIVLSRARWTFTMVTGIVMRAPRATLLGPTQAEPGYVVLLGRRLYVRRRYRLEVAALDAMSLLDADGMPCAETDPFPEVEEW